MKTRILSFVFAHASLLLVAMPRQAYTSPELRLVQDGVSLMPIIIFENAPPYTRHAADELADYIAKSSGARPEVLEGTPTPLPAHAIWVGYQPALDPLFPELNFEFAHPEEILIAANANHLVIAGRDRWDPNGDGEALLKDYYQRGFRSAAAEIEAYWELLQATRNRKIVEKLAFWDAYTPAVFDQAYDRLAQADVRLADDPEVYRQRVAFFRSGLDFTRLMVQTRELMDRYRQSDKTDQDAAEQVRANWDAMRSIAENNLMRFNFIEPGQRYSMGLHPDYP